MLALLQSGSDELLSALTYDEASEILEQKSSDLPATVERELSFYRKEKSDNPEDPLGALPRCGARLRDLEQQKRCARDLLGFDEVEDRRVFDRPVRRRLAAAPEGSSDQRVVPVLPGVRARYDARQRLDGIGAIDLLEPVRHAGRHQHNRTSAAQQLALACARLRLGQAFRDLAGGVAPRSTEHFYSAADEGTVARDLPGRASSTPAPHCRQSSSGCARHTRSRRRGRSPGAPTWTMSPRFEL